MSIKIYQVRKNYNIAILEIECIKATESSYWDSFGRNALETNYVKSFFNKEDAVKYLKYRLESKISSIKGTLEHYEEQLVEFKNLHNL